MPKYPKKFIITGAPGTGKTTLINLLKPIIPCLEEVARKVIISEQEKNNNGVPWENINRFIELVYTQTNKELLNSKTVICDRSLLDLEAYLSVANEPIPDYLGDFPYHQKYERTVFFAPTWFDIYCKDAQRLQEFEYCLKLEKSLLKHYTQKGFNIINLPKSTPLKRKELILETIF